MVITFKLNMKRVKGLPLLGFKSLAGPLQRQELASGSSDLRHGVQPSH